MKKNLIIGIIALLLTSCFALQPTSRPTTVVTNSYPSYGSSYNPSYGNSSYGNSATVTAANYDISYDLDLTAVANAFSSSRNLESFERTLNNYNNRISNLDLNRDGQVDYLRVIETVEHNSHLVIIQAILGNDIYQDVATIATDRNYYNDQLVVQIIGNEYLYGRNYIVQPVYTTRPIIYNYVWGRHYKVWRSPYRWRHYPSHYHAYNHWQYQQYINHLERYHRHHRCTYSYPNRFNAAYTSNVRNNYSRNDYQVRYPSNSFNTRHSSVANIRELRSSRSATNSSSRPGTNSYSSRVTSSSNRTSTSGTSNRNTVTPSRNSSSSSTTSSRTPSTSNRTSSASSSSNRNTTTTPSRTSSSKSSTSSRSSATSSNRSSSKSSSARPATSSSSRTSAATSGRSSSSSKVSPSRSTSSSSRTSSKSTSSKPSSTTSRSSSSRTRTSTSSR